MQKEAMVALAHEIPHSRVPHCDVCGEHFSNGKETFVGMTPTGELVNVSECCRTSLDSIFSRGEFHIPE